MIKDPQLAQTVLQALPRPCVTMLVIAPGLALAEEVSGREVSSCRATRATIVHRPCFMMPPRVLVCMSRRSVLHAVSRFPYSAASLP